ncbi:hypothetical protein [Streptomyces sp. NPDC002763]|uniref:hypothetical protein n=1 Tax=Streptomyces sp. NPDC002763 TaxID=3154427 RepID=UPI00331988D8
MAHLKFSPGRLPFFLAALKRGLVVPAFRTGQLTERVFLDSGQGINDDATRQMRTDIEEWRVAGLAGAKELTVDQGGTGLRRAEIRNAIGHHLELISRHDAYHKPIDFIEDVARNLGPEVGARASFLADVVNLCYQQNQASGLLRDNLSAEPNIPRTLSRAGRAVIREIDPAGSWQTPDQVFQHTVKVPKVRTLLNADCQELLAVRDSTKGASYRHFRGRNSSALRSTSTRRRSGAKLLGSRMRRRLYWSRTA